MADIATIVVRDAGDLDCIRAYSSERLPRKIHFEIQGHSFRAIVAVLSGISDRLNDVEEVLIEADIDWTGHAARHFMTTIAGLPNLRSLTWAAFTAPINENNKIPMPHIAYLFTLCQSLESLFLEGLHFLTTQVVEQEHPDGTIVQRSETLTAFCDALKMHSSLKSFHCAHCQIQDINGETLVQVWVDEMLKSLAHIESLECIEIRVAPQPEDQGRALVGLCKDGSFTVAAIQRLGAILQQESPPIPYQKIRLWIADSFQLKNGPRLLLDLCKILSHNTWLKDFRVRGGDIAAARFVTSSVLMKYKELLESGQNVTLTSCDLIGRQGGEIDLCCRLNGAGRGALLHRLHAMTLQDWIESIILKFSTDLDALNYWLRLQPVFITPTSEVQA